MGEKEEDIAVKKEIIKKQEIIFFGLLKLWFL
jgi:hypothetical protein